jgi:hypothetical protein
MDDDADDRVPFAWGDIGALMLAAGVAVGTLWLIGDMVLGGHPLGVLFGTGQEQTVSAPPPSAEEIRATPMHLEKGEVRLFVPSKPKTPPAKPKSQGNAETPR